METNLSIWQYAFAVLACSCIGSMLGWLVVILTDDMIHVFKSWYRTSRNYFYPPPAPALCYPAEWLLDIFNGLSGTQYLYHLPPGAKFIPQPEAPAFTCKDMNCQNCGAPKMGTCSYCGTH